MFNICAIVDFDGFPTQEGFIVREYGYISIKSQVAASIRFNLSPYRHKLCAKDRRTVRYVENHVCGLPLCPMAGESVSSLESLDSKLLELYRQSKSATQYLVAYKGGCVEKQRLDALNIPNVDLEHYGCPKFDTLCALSSNKDIQKLSCGYHKNNLHCPKAEVTAFNNWLIGNMCLLKDASM